MNFQRGRCLPSLFERGRCLPSFFERGQKIVIFALVAIWQAPNALVFQALIIPFLTQ